MVLCPPSSGFEWWKAVILFWTMGSLVPRPSHRPVFDRLQYAKMEREGLIHLFTWMTSVSIWVEREGGGRGPWSKEHILRTRSSFWIKNFFFCLTNTQNFSTWDRRKKGLNLALSIEHPSPLDSDVINMIKWTKPPPPLLFLHVHRGCLFRLHPHFLIL